MDDLTDEMQEAMIIGIRLESVRLTDQRDCVLRKTLRDVCENA